MGGSVGGSHAVSWDKARYNLTHNDSGTKTYDTVADSLVPSLKSDGDGIVKIKFGTSFWDYAEAVKDLSDDESIKHMDTNKLICQINEDQKNPFKDPGKIKAGCELDLSKYIHAKPDKPSKPVDCDPQPICDDQPQGNTYVNYYETNNFFFIGGQQPQPCGYGQQQPMMQGGYQPMNSFGYGRQQPAYSINVTNNAFLYQPVSIY